MKSTTEKYVKLTKQHPDARILQGTLFERGISFALGLPDVLIMWLQRVIRRDQLDLLDALEIAYAFEFKKEVQAELFKNTMTDNLYIVVSNGDTLFAGFEIRKEPSWLRVYRGTDIPGLQSMIGEKVDKMLDVKHNHFYRIQDGEWVNVSAQLYEKTAKVTRDDKHVSMFTSDKDGSNVELKKCFEKVPGAAISKVGFNDLVTTATDLFDDGCIRTQVTVLKSATSFITNNETTIELRRVTEDDILSDILTVGKTGNITSLKSTNDVMVTEHVFRKKLLNGNTRGGNVEYVTWDKRDPKKTRRTICRTNRNL